MKSSLLPVLRQDTRWYSTYAMLKHYIRLLWLKKLQGDGLTLLDARDLFNGLLEIRPGMSKYLGTYVHILRKVLLKPTFAPTAVRSGSGQGDCRKIRFPDSGRGCGDRGSSGDVSSAESERFADQILKWRKTVAETTRYKLLSAIPPTSNIVERLSSFTRAVLRHERHQLTPNDPGDDSLPEGKRELLERCHSGCLIPANNMDTTVSEKNPTPSNIIRVFPVWWYTWVQPENTTTQSQTEDLFWRWGFSKELHSSGVEITSRRSLAVLCLGPARSSHWGSVNPGTVLHKASKKPWTTYAPAVVDPRFQRPLGSRPGAGLPAPTSSVTRGNPRVL
ncbi:Hypothetical protein PHPALM_7761 [Phytophthora palmivora]|uniref:Uncharacterized protein n=1 Tax=Phytophthora palmivora TaxID=4796 RepID=A0A2P4YBH9_9STRA|nr:Hypothetical protein PHPALM_7761 [Phytophthora palmivora]